MGRSLLACSKSVDRCVRFSGEGAPVHPQKPHAGTDIDSRVGPRRPHSADRSVSGAVWLPAYGYKSGVQATGLAVEVAAARETQRRQSAVYSIRRYVSRT